MSGENNELLKQIKVIRDNRVNTNPNEVNPISNKPMYNPYNNQTNVYNNYNNNENNQNSNTYNYNNNDERHQSQVNVDSGNGMFEDDLDVFNSTNIAFIIGSLLVITVLIVIIAIYQ